MIYRQPLPSTLSSVGHFGSAQCAYATAISLQQPVTSNQQPETRNKKSYEKN
jgi:hypothetical protein